MQTLKNTATTIILLILSLLSVAQVPLSENLQEKLNTNSAEIHIYIHLADRVNIKNLQKYFLQNKTQPDERATTTLNMLQNKAKTSQKSLLSYLKKSQGQVSNIKSFWITNLISLNATPAFIYQLQQRDDIAYISSDDRVYFYEKPKFTGYAPEKTNNTEEGLLAINADKLWALGYSGKNTIVLGVDTGVKFKHPAIAEKFLGKYRPLNEAWFGYNNISPDDISFSSTHGTHTMGTVLGLDKTAQDTIGVAWNAYWMAADPIVSSIADVRPLERILESFQFALNPDGDINTTDDMPDVITNSWGWDSFYSNADCNVPEADAINAAATAGIGVVFSAGNDGPAAGTIGQPANLATNLFNVFSVGAVNGYSSEFPIADFSSHGPTSCVDESDGYSLWVKPEVVAPGENVRSAMGDDDYGNLSGTSMACPHVAGAFLLLKEAFPDLAGEEILAALYYSAVDLGDSGEDNTYGNGIIDVKAAFDTLSITHTPANPVDNSYDIAIAQVFDYPIGFSPKDSINFKIGVKNTGNEPFQGVNISVQANNSSPEILSYNDEILPGDTAIINIENLKLEKGKNQIRVYCDLMIDVPESDLINNTSFFNVYRPQIQNLPFSENFDTTQFNQENSSFIVVNHDQDWTWVVDTAGGLPNSDYSMRLDFTKSKYQQDQKDDLISPLLNIPESTDDIVLKFKHAYAARLQYLYKDTLQISVSIDGGLSWPTVLFSKSDTALATVEFNSGSSRFIPDSEEDWQENQLNLSAFKGQQILIRFRGINDNGSNLYLDDIEVSEGEFTSNKALKNNPGWSFYPNPTHDKLIINKNGLDFSEVYIYNSLGVLHDILFVNTHTQHFSIKDLPKGVYFIKPNSENVLVKKLVIN